VLQRARTIHDYAVSRCTAYGGTPGGEPGCSDMELNYSALALIAEGHDEYWDQIDRFIRNHTTEAQFTDPEEWVEEKASESRIINDLSAWAYSRYPDDLPRLPYSDYDDVLSRSVGGFCWTSADEHIFLPGFLMICCSANAMRSFRIVQDRALVEEKGTVSVNLHFNHQNPLGEIISYEPYAGKVSVVLNADHDHLRIRIPEYAVGSPITGTVSGREAELSSSGRYVVFDRVKSGDEYSIEFRLREAVEEDHELLLWPGDPPDLQNSETARSRPLQVVWRGNTVMAVKPDSQEPKRVYKRSELDTPDVVFDEQTHFISDDRVRW
jgi:hypothetical protein